jgi:hypothetical protein
MQQRAQFDSETIEKIKKSFVITMVGIVLTAGSYLGGNFLNWIAYGDVIDWRTPLIMSLSALGAFIYNTLTEWMNGQ